MQVETLSQKIEKNAHLFWGFFMFLMFGILFYSSALIGTFPIPAFATAGIATIMIAFGGFLDELQQVEKRISNLNLMFAIGSAAFLGAIYWINFM